MLVGIGGPIGWILFALIWALCIFGITMQRVLMRQRAAVTAIPYIALGWIAVLMLKPLMDNTSPWAVVLLLAGGVTYTVGVLFFVWRRLPYHHAVWHVFVLSGSAFHFFAVLLFVIPILKR